MNSTTGTISPSPFPSPPALLWTQVVRKGKKSSSSPSSSLNSPSSSPIPPLTQKRARKIFRTQPIFIACSHSIGQNRSRSPSPPSDPNPTRPVTQSTHYSSETSCSGPSVRLRRKKHCYR